MNSRRNFIKKAALGTAGLSLISAKSFSNIIGSNKQLNVAMLGCGGRAYGLAQSIGLCENTKLTYICDVDQKRVEKFKSFCQDKLGSVPASETDFRTILDRKDIDAVFVATPEHWHAPMAIMAMQAGKHVYVEKPCSHNPHENELIIAVQKKTGMHCQMGNQQRSSVTSAMAIKEIQEGIIGDVYAGKAWYTNTRGPIGKGKVVPVPEHLDWNLWQGPAPREAYRDNVHPYNWHWFRTWGTGEIHNNGTHEIDICRWALGVKYPNRVVSTGGRLHGGGDDWEYYDTQMASYEFEDNKLITWDGQSCNGYGAMGGRGATILGTKGAIWLNRAKYELFDLKGKKIKTEWEGNQGTSNNTSDTQGFDGLTTRHIQNFVNAVINNESLKSPIADGAIATQLCHLGNLAQDLGESLKVDPVTGRVLDNKKAQKLWKREYEKGWEPKL